MTTMLRLPTALVALSALVMAAPSKAQTGPPATNDSSGVMAAAMDYMEGAVTADAERVARGVHPELNKVVINTLPNQRQVLGYTTASSLVETVRGFAERMAGVDRSVDVTVFDIGAGVASARAVGQLWYDLLQLAKVDGQWRLVEVLWARNGPNGDGTDATGTEADRADVERVVMDYVDGIYSGDAERVEKALHPEMNRVEVRTNGQTGRSFLDKMGFSLPVEAARAGLATVEPDRRNITIEIFDVSHGIASAKVTSVGFIEHLQVGRVNGEWKIINALSARR